MVKTVDRVFITGNRKLILLLGTLKLTEEYEIWKLITHYTNDLDVELPLRR